MVLNYVFDKQKPEGWGQFGKIHGEKWSVPYITPGHGLQRLKIAGNDFHFLWCCRCLLKQRTGGLQLLECLSVNTCACGFSFADWGFARNAHNVMIFPWNPTSNDRQIVIAFLSSSYLWQQSHAGIICCCKLQIGRWLFSRESWSLQGLG